MGNCAHPPPSPKPGEDSSCPLSERELLGLDLAARGCSALPQLGGTERPRGARSSGAGAAVPARGPGGLSGLGGPHRAVPFQGWAAWAPCPLTAPRHGALLRLLHTRGLVCRAGSFLPSFFPPVFRLGSRSLLISWKYQQPPGRLLVINHSLQRLTPLPNN